MEPSDAGSASQQASTSIDSVDTNVETMMNLALLDPPRWGWSAAGGVVDLLPPHERARRTSAQEIYMKQMRRKERIEARKKKEENSQIFPGSAQQTPMMVEQHSVPPLSDGKVSATDHVTTVMDNRGGPLVAEQRTNGPQDAASWATLTAQGDSKTGASTVDDNVATLHSAMVQAGEVSETSIHTQVSRESASSQPILATLGEATNTDVAVDTSDPDTSFDIQSSTKKESNRMIEVKALNEYGVLDMYTYHRGREGSEPRDEETGQLLCDVEPTDTNHGWEPPNLTIMINVVFPLSDIDDEAKYNGELKDDDENDSAGSSETKRHAQRPKQEQGLEYRETIEWDLADPRTLTPLCFATGIGQEFGLDACQTLELAESIQRQINEFVQNKVSYKIPFPLTDAYGNERPYPSSMGGAPQLYGSAIGETKEGMPVTLEKRLQSTTSGLAGLDRGANSKRQQSTATGLAGLERRSNLRSVPTEVEREYTDEVLRRAREASTKDIEKKSREGQTNGVVGALKKETDYVCHYCHSRRRQCRKFACNQSTHALCDSHITSMIGISIDRTDGAPIAVDFCPICSLMCDCKNCTKTLLSVSSALKRRCIDQDKPPEQVSFDDLFQRCNSKRMKSRERRLSSKDENVTVTHMITVPKVPVHEFPREVSGGRDLDPGTSDDYRTVFTAEGAFIPNDLPGAAGNSEMASTSGDGAVEDGNVDYCHTCMMAGNLLCCDVCPRAFHPECIPSDKPTEGDWECFVCRKEKEITADDVVTGVNSLDLVCAPFVDVKHSSGYDSSLQVLSLIHEMILKLMDYDFGFLFREPVDCDSVPGYSVLVKKPMDLGTIGVKLIKGDYIEEYRRNLAWDDVLVAVLQDIELVWHNCFTFNCEGSSIYRMAEVQRKKYQKTRERSIDHLLSDEVKQRVDEYVSACERERSKMVRMEKDASLPPTLERRASGGRNKITVARCNMSRMVAVLDPETGLLVKIYSSLKSSCLAALFLVGLGYPSEFPELLEKHVRSIIRRAAQEPSLLLFGFRWLYMDDLIGRKVKFGATTSAPADMDKAEPSCHVEMMNGGEACLFLSIEEAVSRPELPEGVSIASIRQTLCETPFGESTSVGEFSWKRLDPEGIRPPEMVAPSRDPFPANFAFVKEDLLSRRVLVGFESAVLAHRDWLATREGSPVFPVDEPTNIEYFKSYYLDGERNVDGMIWRTAKVAQPHHLHDSSPVSEDLAHFSQPSHPSASSANTTPELENGVGAHSMEAQTELTSTNGKEVIEAIEEPSLPPGTSPVLQNAAFLGQMNGQFSPITKNGTKANGSLLGAKRNRDDNYLGPGGTSKKTAIYSNL